MDIARIRALLGECFVQGDDPRSISAELDTIQAELTLRVLKTVFEQELAALPPHAPKHKV